MKKKILLLCYGLALTAFTTYIALDTFVLSAAYQTDATQVNTSMFADAENSSSEKEEEANTDTADKPAKKSRHGGKHKSYAYEGTDDSSDS